MFDNKNSKYKSPSSFSRNNNSGLKKINNSFFETRFSPIVLLAILVIAISFLTRIALLFKTGKSFDSGFKNIAGSFALGTLFDLAMASYLIVPFVLLIWFTSDKIYSKKWKWFVIGSYLFPIIVLILILQVALIFLPIRIPAKAR